MIILTAEQAQQIEEALIALHLSGNTSTGVKIYFDALTTIRAARAQEQAEQEPVGECEVYIGENGEANFDSFRFTLPKHFPSGSYKLYAHPVRTKDLTDDEIAQAVGSLLDEVYLADFRAVIAADREKNK